MLLITSQGDNLPPESLEILVPEITFREEAILVEGWFMIQSPNLTSLQLMTKRSILLQGGLTLSDKIVIQESLLIIKTLLAIK